MVAFAGYPLVVQDRVLGVMAMFARHPLSEFVPKALASVASGLAVGIERKRAEEALRSSEERLRQAQKMRSEEHTSELQSHSDLVCRLLLEKKKKNNRIRS